MKTTDFTPNISSAKLKENIAKQFGANVALDKYNREQLEDLRNKLRTRVFQHEGKSGYNDLLHNEGYQKDKAMLELLNTRIKEMLGEDIKKLRDRMVELSEAKKGTRPPKTKITAKGSKPDFLDLDKDGNKKEPMKKAAKDKDVKEASFWGQDKLADKLAKNRNGGTSTVVDKDSKGKVKTTTTKTPAKDKDVKEGWDDMMKSVKDKSGPQPNGGSGVKKGKAYGGSAQKDEKEPEEKKSKKVKEGAKPDFLDLDKDGNKKEPMKKAAKHAKGCDCNECSTMEGKDEGKPGKNFAKIAKSAGKEYGSKKAGERVAGAVRAKLAKQGKLQESNMSFKHNVRFVNESIAFLLSEDEEGKAKAITAAGDMVNDFTSWMQRVGQYQTKTMIELADAIKADFGAQEAEAFKQAVAPSLSQTLEVLTQQREAISNAVAVLAGEASPMDAMGAEPGMGGGMPQEPGMDMAGPDEMNPMPAGGDEFGASDAAAGGPEASGRAMRESKEERKARKLAEAHSIMARLAK